jgi:hypothetical protein
MKTIHGSLSLLRRERSSTASLRSTRRLGLTVVVLMTLVAGWSREAAAQTRTVPPPRATQTRPSAGREARLEVSGSVGWTGAYDLGSVTATLTGNGVPTGSPVTFFETDTQVEGGPRIEGRLAWRLTRMFAVEGGLAVTRTHLRTDITNDAEQAPPISAKGRLTEYAIEGGVVVHLSKLAFGGGRARPFVTGGAGYLRQLHDGATLVDTGTIAFVGGGVRYALREATRKAFVKTIGLRGDVRVDVRTNGFETAAGTSPRAAASVSGGVFVGL